MKSLYAITLVLSLIIASCDNPTDNKSTKKEPPNPIAKYKSTGTTLTFVKPIIIKPTITKPRRDNSYTQTVTEKKLEGDEGAITYTSSNPAVATVNASTGKVTFVDPNGGTVTITATKAGTPKYQAQIAQYTLKIDHPKGSTIAFENEEDFQLLSEETYTQTASKERNVADDEGVITYKSSDTGKATVNPNTGVVKLHNLGKVTITATKEATGKKGYDSSKNKYTLYITTRPINQSYLGDEIKKAIAAHGNKADLNYIDPSAVTYMALFFSGHHRSSRGLGAFEGDISKWNVSNVTEMAHMFSITTKFNSDISNWNVSNVTSMSSMFWRATAFNSNISNWNVSNVTIMYSMFKDATKFNQDISGWDVRKVEDMRDMFRGATAFKQNLNAWGSRINDKIKADNWAKAAGMFLGSGLKDSLPNWCDTVPACKSKQR